MPFSPTTPPPDLGPPRFRGRNLAGVFVLAWVPRLALALAYLHLPLGLDDMYQYDMLGLSLARGHGYRWYQSDYVERIRPYLDKYYLVDLSTEVPEEGYISTFRPPGYPAFLAVVYAVVGESNRLAVVRLLQSALGAALAPLTLLLARRLRLSERAGAVGAGLVALYPILWMYPVGLGSENLFLPLTLAGLIATLRAGDDRRPLPTAVAGLALGAAALTRSVLVLFVGLAALWLARRRGWRRGLLLAGVAAATIAPWAVRNSLVLGRPAFIENSLGFNLFVSYHPEGDGGFVADVAVLATHLLDDAARDAWAMEQATGFILADPLRAVGTIPLRLAYLAGFEVREMLFFYSNGFFGPLPTALLSASLVLLILPWGLIALGAGFGLASADHRAGRDLVLLLVAATVAAHLPILSEPRFHLPLVPALAPYAAAALLSPRAAFGRTGSAWAWLAAIVLLALWVWDPAGIWPRIATVLAPGGHQLRFPY